MAKQRVEPKKVFLITPKMVGRFVGEMQQYVDSLEAGGGCAVYWPWRDDPKDVRGDDGVVETAYHIRQIQQADECHVWYWFKSQSVHMMLGVVAALRKPLIIVPRDVEYDSKFFRLLQNWQHLLEGLDKGA